MSENVFKIPGKQQEPEVEILTLKEAAAFIKVKPRTLYEHVQRKTIPHLRAGKLIRFSRQSLFNWMQEQAEN